MLTLSDSQAKRFSDMERASFLRHCERIGCSPSQREAMILQAAKRELVVLLASFSSDASALSQFKGFAEPYLAANDLWTLKRHQTRTDVALFADRIVTHRFHLPINWAYLERLSVDMGVKAPASSGGDSLSSFLQSLLHIRLYENAFNAFVRKGMMLDKIPCVCVHELLITSCEFFLDVMHKGMFQPVTLQSEFQLRQLESTQLRQVGENPEFLRACHECLEMILGRKPELLLYPSDLASRSDPAVAPLVKIMVSGCQHFVWYHEYGHLLQGHLEVGPCHKIEYEADLFAWRLIHADAEEQYGQSAFWYRVGALSAFSILWLIEAIARTKESTTHPTAWNRLGAVIRSLEKTEACQLMFPAGAILVLCEATVQRYYGLRYRAPL